jgi:phytanoyl-CoA hydroxylase
MDTAALRRAYETDGFVVVRQFLPTSAFNDLCSALDRYIAEVVPSLPPSDAFYVDRTRPETLKQLTRMEQSPHFAADVQHPAWRTLAESLLCEPVEHMGCEWFNKPAGTRHVTPPHQDNWYFCLDLPHVLTMWLALDEVDEENGCLRYVRGSHRHPLRPHRRTQTLGFSQGIFDYGDTDRADEVAVTCRPNDLLIHHGNTIHHADANVSAVRQRRSFAMVFRGVSARRDEAAFQRYLASSQAQQESLGATMP